MIEGQRGVVLRHDRKHNERRCGGKRHDDAGLILDRTVLANLAAVVVVNFYLVRDNRQVELDDALRRALSKHGTGPSGGSCSLLQPYRRVVV